jgi:hypothetical protein
MSRARIIVTTVVVLIAALCGFSATAHAEATTAYFVVANPALMLIGMSDSYVLPLSDPADIAIARELVVGQGFLIVVATVTPGADGINRDMLAPGTPEWSWHVSEFLAFATAAIELCDGRPTFTEVDAQNAGEGEEWDICYWNYTVVAEIAGPSPVEQSTWGKIKALFRVR